MLNPTFTTLIKLKVVSINVNGPELTVTNNEQLYFLLTNVNKD